MTRKRTAHAKRATLDSSLVGSSAVFALASGGRGDPHLVGPEGVKYTFGGTANGTYALFTAPAFVVNMQLAATGPANRFMTRVGVVLGGEAVTITPQLRHNAAALSKFFEAHGANVSFSGSALTATLCNDHVLTIEARYAPWAKLNFLNVAVSVPGCHDAYGGALGQTYRCEYVSGAKPFVWSRALEESFRVKSLATPSGTYSPTADCAHEDEFQGAPFTGGSSTSSDGVMTMQI